MKILFPYFIALFPVMFLFSTNKREFVYSDLFLPIAVLLMMTYLMWKLFTFIFQDRGKAAILASFITLCIFTYRNLFILSYRLINNAADFDSYKYQALFLVVWFAFLIVGVKFIQNKLKLTRNGNSFMTTFSLLLLLQNISPLVLPRLKTADTANMQKEAQLVRSVIIDNKPDIYYIVVDAYGRDDILKRVYSYDNTPFTSLLKDRGFNIVVNSYSNFNKTYISIASSLNMDYASEINKSKNIKGEIGDYTEMIANNKVASILKQNGYSIVSFPSLDKTVGTVSADVYGLSKVIKNKLSQSLLEMTPLPMVRNYSTLKWQPSHGMLREHVLKIFDKLPGYANDYSPKFVFAYIPIPHPPFIFDEYGNLTDYPVAGNYDGSHLYDYFSVSKEEYKSYYIDQLKFVNSKLIAVVDRILETEDQQPVIIIQADHGPRSGWDWEEIEKTDLSEGFGILNAYYFPNVEEIPQDVSLTPVNTFRLLFNTYFGYDYEMLDTKIYYTDAFDSAFINVTDRLLTE